MIESAKGEIDASKEEELLNLMDKLDDDEVFDKFKKDVQQENVEKPKAAEPAPETAVATKTEEDSNKNKRRADETVPEKEPSKKKTKDNKKKKALAMGGVSMFGGKDLFGGKNPFASRKQEESSEEEEELEDQSEDDSKLTASNGDNRSIAPPPPPPMPTFNIAVQPDSEEQPVSFDDLPSSTHVILTSNKHRAKLPSRRRPTGRGVHTNGHAANGNGHALEGSDNN